MAEFQSQQQPGYENQGQQSATSPYSAVNTSGASASGYQQQTATAPSISSNSSSRMANHFPTAQATSSPPFRHQQQGEGQLQRTAPVSTNTNTFNAGPHISGYVPTAAQRFAQPIRPPGMAQQHPTRPAGPPQFPPGIPGYSSQIEGLSVSQAVVNDVLVDLQSKVINETLQQYQNESSSGTHLEPLPPIYIQAPQPTIILRSDMHRLRAELGTRVRPQTVFRNPAGANQFQQQQFQQNIFQAPRFPAPPQQHNRPDCYGDYRNAAVVNSDEYTPTTGDGHSKEKEERLYNQAWPPTLNDDNINDNVHSTLDHQGLSTTSFHRHASPYQSSSFLPHFKEQQQGNEDAAFTSSHNINDEGIGRTDNMFPRPTRPRPEITFDITNCINRCFEAHRQQVARRRAARQARRARRHRQSGQPQQRQYQHSHTQQVYPAFDAAGQVHGQQQPPTSSHYSDVFPGSTNASTAVHTSQGPYSSAGLYDYTNVGQSTSLPTDIHTSQIPFSSLSTSNIDTAIPTDLRSSEADYYQYKTIDAQEPYIHSHAYQYAPHQTVSSTTTQLSNEYPQEQTSYNYSNQLPYPSHSSTDATVPSEIQNLSSDYYQQHQQQIPTQFIQSQGNYEQPPGTYDYNTGNIQSQLPTYDYQNVEQPSFQYPHYTENIQQQPSFDYTKLASTAYAPSETDINQIDQTQPYDYTQQGLHSSDYYQQQPLPVHLSQVQGGYGQPTGTYEYTREGYQSQQPTYSYPSTEQQSSQYTYGLKDIQQVPQQDSYNFDTKGASSYLPSEIDTNLTEQNQTLSLSDYYQQQPIAASTSQGQDAYAQPTGTYEYTSESYQSQQPSYDYQGADQQASQYTYDLKNVQQIPQQDSYNYATAVIGSYAPSEIDTSLTEQKQTTNYYQQQPIPASSSQGHDAYTQPTGAFEYTREGYQSQQPTYDYQGADQQSSQYTYDLKDVQQVPHQDSYNYATADTNSYLPPGINSNITEQKQTTEYSNQAVASSDYYQQQPVSVPVSRIQEGYGHPTGTYEYTRETYQSQQPTYDYQSTDQQSSQYSYDHKDVQPIPHQDSYNYATAGTSTYLSPGIDTSLTEQNQTIGLSDYYQQQPIPASTSQGQDAYAQPTGTYEYTREDYQSQVPTYDYPTTQQQSSQYTYDLKDVQQIPQQDSYNFNTEGTSSYLPSAIDTNLTEQNQTLGVSDYYQQQSIPASTSQGQDAYAQPTGTYEYTREDYQSQEPTYHYPTTAQQSSQYSYNLENNSQEQPQQQQTFNYASDTTTAYPAAETDTQQSEQIQTVDYSTHPLSSSDQYQQQPISISVSRVDDAQHFGQQSSGTSVPTGTVEYTRQAYYSQEPLSDNYTTETFIAQHQQQKESESLPISDYLERFQSESYPLKTGGPIKSSDDGQSITTITTTPFNIQQNVDIHPPQGAAPTYDLQNYTNENIASEGSQPPHFSSLCHEEDRQRLLQQISPNEQPYETLQQPTQYSEKEASTYDTYSSLPPPPPATEDIDYQQGSIATNTSDFPPPPTPDRHTYQIPQQRPSRSFTSIIPSTDQPSIYTERQPLEPTSPPSSDHGTDDDAKEDEETFDLRRCIAECYAKYKDLWNKNEQQQYEDQIGRSQHPTSDANRFHTQHFGPCSQLLSEHPMSDAHRINTQHFGPCSQLLSEHPMSDAHRINTQHFGPCSQLLSEHPTSDAHRINTQHFGPGSQLLSEHPMSDAHRNQYSNISDQTHSYYLNIRRQMHIESIRNISDLARNYYLNIQC